MKTKIVLVLASLGIAPLAQAQCVGDVAVDSRVDGGDLGVLLANWGPVTSTALSRACDFDGNGQIDGADLGALLANWGACPAPTWATVLESQPDPAVVADASLRAAIRATGLPWRVRDDLTGIEMLLVPPGTFQMGCSESAFGECSSYEQPVHAVTFTQPFYLGRYEVTQAQFVQRMGFNPSQFHGLSGAANHPVENVGYGQMREFLASTGMRFPTEPEWEYACRAGTTSAFHNGSSDSDSLDGIAWFGANSDGQTHPVGLKQPNRMGFFDMLGNVAEWIEGCPDYYPSTPRLDPIDRACTEQAPWWFTSPRGGAWLTAASSTQSSTRIQLRCCWATSGVSGAIGFRVARNP